MSSLFLRSKNPSSTRGEDLSSLFLRSKNATALAGAEDLSSLLSQLKLSLVLTNLAMQKFTTFPSILSSPPYKMPLIPY